MSKMYLSNLEENLDLAVPRVMVWPPKQWDCTDVKERAEALAWITDFIAGCE